jgi:c-di-GMP-binding flagellar brake protein YcgR
MAVNPSQWEIERRQHLRVKAAFQAELRREDNGALLRVETADISSGGFYVEMMFTLEVGCRLDVVLWLGAEKVSVRCIVVTQHPQFGNGIKFLDLKPEDQQRLRVLLETWTTNHTTPHPM